MLGSGGLSVARDSPDGVNLPQERVFEVLRNERRRYALHYLKRTREPADVGELVDRVAAWENDCQPSALTASQRQRVHVSLLQYHLPAMQEAGVVRFDPDRRRVALTEAARDVDIYVEAVSPDDIAWGQYYLGVVLFNAVFLALVASGIYPFAAIPPVGWLLFVAGLFVLAAAVHYRYQRRTPLGASEEPVRWA